MKLLSILIPSIPVRTELLHRLLCILAPQVTPEVEILINMDSGAKTIGDKRNSLLRAAEGEYVSFIDDDDRVSEDYVKQLLAGIAQGVDVVSIRGLYFENGVQKGITLDKPYQAWRTIPGEGTLTFLRGVQHLDAIRREIAQSVKFESRSFGEDSVFGKTIEMKFPNLTSHQIPTDVYFYYYDSRKPRR
jgi:glycosyltransferase involved in cell wall biosynthesis